MRLRIIVAALIWGVIAIAIASAQSPPMVNSASYRVFSGTTVNHTFTQMGGTPPITWDNFTFEGFSGTHIEPFVPATFDPNTQLFSWFSIGSRRAEYMWSVRASNGAGSSTGTITIETYIPEPGSVSLFALGLIGLGGLARRR